MSSVIVWDIETVPDLKGFARANGHDGKSDDEIRVAMGDKFPKHIYHSIICIGGLVATTVQPRDASLSRTDRNLRRRCGWRCVSGSSSRSTIHSRASAG
jgi:hypothetical protein